MNEHTRKFKMKWPMMQTKRAKTPEKTSANIYRIKQFLQTSGSDFFNRKRSTKSYERAQATNLLSQTMLACLFDNSDYKMKENSRMK